MGFVASNIYKIWILRFDKIIFTYNVRFNKEIFYIDSKKEIKIFIYKIKLIYEFIKKNKSIVN